MLCFEKYLIEGPTVLEKFEEDSKGSSLPQKVTGLEKFNTFEGCCILIGF